MQLKDYQKWTNTTVVFPPENAEAYLLNGLVSEVGEFCGAIAKYNRGDYDVNVMEQKIRKEAGDILWFLAQIAELYEWELEELLQENHDKLVDRLQRNVIKGNGDNR